jgi:hypothetical protein
MQIGNTNIRDPFILALIKEKMDVVKELFSIIENYLTKGIFIDIALELELDEKDSEERGLPCYNLTLSIQSPQEERLYGTVREWDEDHDLGFVIFKPE